MAAIYSLRLDVDGRPKVWLSSKQGRIFFWRSLQWYASHGWKLSPRRVTPEQALNFMAFCSVTSGYKTRISHQTLCWLGRAFRFLQFPDADFKFSQLGCNLFGPGCASALNLVLLRKDRNLLIITTAFYLKRKPLKTNDVMTPICSQLLFSHLLSVWKKHLTIFLMNVTRSFHSAGALH